MGASGTARRAALQMDRDGVRMLTPGQRIVTLCGHVENPAHPIVIRCHKHASYSTPSGNRCFAHAITDGAAWGAGQ